MSIKVLQIQKRSSYQYKFIQDKYAINIPNKTFALADGTTQSFCSEIWAAILTMEFIKFPVFNSIELISKFKQCADQYKSTKFEFSANSAIASVEKAKLQKGGTSTFLGLQFLETNQLNIITCGDSNLFQLKKDSNIIPFPFSNINSLDNNNYFINTEQLLEGKIDETFFILKTIDFEIGDKIIIATDALSRFIFKNTDKLTEITGIADFESLYRYCLKYWESKELEEDDISAIIIDIDNIGDYIEIVPPKDFSFPKEKDTEFIPNSLQQNSTNNFTDMEIQEIKNQFNGVKNDFDQVKKKQQKIELLLIIAISLLILNLFAVFYFTSSKKVSEPKSSDSQSNGTIEKIFSKINSLEQILKSPAKPTPVDTTKKTEPDNPVPTLSTDEAIHRQKEMKKAGCYNGTINGKWGAKSQKLWIECQAKIKSKPKSNDK